jgi:hypothetical protein
MAALEQVRDLTAAEAVDEVRDVLLVSAPVPLAQLGQKRRVGIRVGPQLRAARLAEVGGYVVAMRRPVPVLPGRKTGGPILDRFEGFR